MSYRYTRVVLGYSTHIWAEVYIFENYFIFNSVLITESPF